MRTIVTGAVTGLLCLGGLVAEAEAKQKAYQVMADAMTFALHDAAFTMYHEVGHLLVGELGLPVWVGQSLCRSFGPHIRAGCSP